MGYLASLPPLPAHLQRIVDAEYPRYSDAEMQRRRKAVESLLAENSLDHLVFCGAGRSGSVVQWLTHWPVTTEAICVFTPGLPDTMYLQYVNHPPLARRIAKDATVEWGGESSIRAVIAELTRRGAKPGRVGFMGVLLADNYAALADKFGPVRGLNRAYAKLRQVKSAEELDWFRIGAHFSDRGMAGLADGLVPGRNERQLADAIERNYIADGCTTGIHFIGATPMQNPSIAAPCQYPSTRKVEAGDVVSSEISAAFWDHTGQVLRSFTVQAEPTPLYRDLHAAADAAFDAVTKVLKAGATPAQVIEASGVIEQAGFTVIDDLVHGYGGGYFQPILGTRSRPAGPIPEDPFRAGQVVVVQPNVVTRDGKAGVQTGEMILITETGVERMHAFPRGFIRID
jgi:Xaa-Pro aminopeptidase